MDPLGELVTVAKPRIDRAFATDGGVAFAWAFVATVFAPLMIWLATAVSSEGVRSADPRGLVTSPPPLQELPASNTVARVSAFAIVLVMVSSSAVPEVHSSTV